MVGWTNHCQSGSNWCLVPGIPHMEVTYRWSTLWIKKTTLDYIQIKKLFIAIFREVYENGCRIPIMLLTWLNPGKRVHLANFLEMKPRPSEWWIVLVVTYFAYTYALLTSSLSWTFQLVDFSPRPHISVYLLYAFLLLYCGMLNGNGDLHLSKKQKFVHK